MKLTRRAALLALPLGLGGCSWIENLFSDNKPSLPGKREDVLAARRGLEIDPNEKSQVVVPPPAPMPEWPQAGGTPAHVGGNLAVSGLRPAWKADIGEGGGYRAKITSQPVVAGGRVFTMDSNGMVAAFDVQSGSRQWRTDTQGEHDRSTNLGGGIAVVGGTIYATTGRAEALGLDAATGKINWRKGISSPARSAPTVVDGKLYFTTLDDQLLALSAADGTRVWAYQATTSATTVLASAAPAVAGGFVVAGFGSGDLITVRADSGTLAWSDSLAAARGRNSLLDLSAVRGLPVIDRERIYAIGIGGLFVCLDLRSGRRLWEREFGGGQTPWVAGDWIYVVSTDQALAALTADEGRVRWVSDLQRWDDPEKQKDPIFWSGPVMAGGKLVLVSTNGKANSVDPVTGKILGQDDLSDAATLAPVVAANTMFVVTDDGTLQAFR